jgi:ABC-type transport system substrate-binding protein
MYVLPSHLLDTIPMAALERATFGRQPVGTGRFRFARWEPGQRIEIIADTANARGRAKLDRVIWSIAPDFGASTVKLFAGEADFLEQLRPENLAQVSRTPSLRLIDNRALSYGFLGFNFRDRADPSRPNAMFGDVRVRRALHMAVDRERLVRNVFDSLGMVALAPAPRALIQIRRPSRRYGTTSRRQRRCSIRRDGATVTTMACVITMACHSPSVF